MNATPWALADNLFEAVVLYEQHEVTVGSELVGYEHWRAFDGLRTLTAYHSVEQDALEFIEVDCQVSRAADTIVVDRGYAFGGGDLLVRGKALDADPWTTVITRTPGTDGTDTAEGAWWETFTEASYRYWRVEWPSTAATRQIILSGLTLGKRVKFKNYLHRPTDPDRRELNWSSDRRTPGGLRARTQLDAPRMLDDRLTLYDEAEYIAGVRKWVTQIGTGGAPFWWCLDETNSPDEVWQFLNTATRLTWPFEQAKGRTGRIVAEENLPKPGVLYL